MTTKDITTWSVSKGGIVKRKAGANFTFWNDCTPFEKEKIIEKFNISFIKSDGCWNWSRTKYEQGYGILHCCYFMIRAHRLSWIINNEMAIPAGKVVRHTCDNPSCVNPDHLILGTQAENMNDMVERGRSLKPIEYSHIDLTEDKILSILNFKGSITDCAKANNVNFKVAWSIRNGQTWSHIHPQIERLKYIKRTILSVDDIEFIKQSKLQKTQIAKMLSISTKTVRKIKNNER